MNHLVATQLLNETESDEEARQLLTEAGFRDIDAALNRFREMCPGERARDHLEESLPVLMLALTDAAVPDASLVNFDRYVQSVPDRTELFRYLAEHPRSVEILIRLFVGSQFLTEILLRNPSYLVQLTQHKRIAEIKSREEFLQEELSWTEQAEGIARKLDELRRYQRWELLRIGACDAFGLLDLRSVTTQLSLLADSLVQACMKLLASELDVNPSGFAVLAFGKLGGEELNYSSDIDLVFLAQDNATKYWSLGQRLIKALTESTSEGFLYRVDMRLRPWGNSGSLVNTIDAHIKYLETHGMAWEKQALLKARCIAGSMAVGQEFLERARPQIFNVPPDVIRENIRGMKSKIESELDRQGRKWGEVKSGEGSIRDIEFVTQYLQLAHGGENRHLRATGTLDGLIRLTDFGFVRADEYRQLTSGYLFFRTIEHSLQLMHHKQTHSLPDNEREQKYLARRLDYSTAERFLAHYERHREAVRAIYDRYIGNPQDAHETSDESVNSDEPAHVALMEESYAATFSNDEILRHSQLLQQLSEDNIVEAEAEAADNGQWRVTVVGYDTPGDLSFICGLLFVYGFDITAGNVFTDEQALTRDSRTGSRAVGRAARSGSKRKFVNVFSVTPPLEIVLPEVWIRYRNDLNDLMQLVQAGQQRKAQGRLAKRVANALWELPDEDTTLFSVDIEIDNETSERQTVLTIQSDDTIGFLYELANALSMNGISINRMIVRSHGNRVDDTLYVTDAEGGKIIDETRQRELRAATVLIKHFTHLLPRSPNPEAALLHFRDFLEQLLEQSNWTDQLSSLERPDVLNALARLLGVSDFLWEDFLRLQHENLFPVVTDPQALAHAKSREELTEALAGEMAMQDGFEKKKNVLNAFKDREMFRIDMRHIQGETTEFGEFSNELTVLAEVVVGAAYVLCDTSLRKRYGDPLREDGCECRMTIAALGKCGGRELGYASDIELMFIYDGPGKTDGEKSITTAEYYQKLVESFTQVIESRQKGIFEIDLRLRPYGKAGSLAVAFDAFENYFGPDGAAWPYERQALVKLRQIAGHPRLGDELIDLRNRLIYTGEPFDVVAMRAMREKQVRQLVRAGTTNAKLGPGGLVDCEYLTQGLQITYGGRITDLRNTNTREAIEALYHAGILSEDAFHELTEAYMFLRNVIDSLRMVRGHARDLTLPDPDSEEFEFLARRIGYRSHIHDLRTDFERCTEVVQKWNRVMYEDATNGN